MRNGKTYLQNLWTRLEKAGATSRGHVIRIWQEAGEWRASADQCGGIGPTPEAAIEAAVDHAASVGRVIARENAARSAYTWSEIEA